MAKQLKTELFMDDDTNVFQYVERWDHPAITHRCNGTPSQFYAIEYSTTDQIESIYIPFVGLGRKFEASAHELAHIVDFVLRGRMERVFKQNYGNLSFDRMIPDERLEQAFFNEVRVMAIEVHIMELTAAPLPSDVLAQLVASVYDLTVFQSMELNNDLEKGQEFYQTITKASIEATIEQYLTEIDKRCLPQLRRKVLTA